MSSSDPKLITGQRAVTAAGTPEALMEAVAKDAGRVLVVDVRAHLTNTDNIYVGGEKTVSSTTGRILSPGETWTVDVRNLGIDASIDLAHIWIDAAVSGEGVSYSALRWF